MGEISFKTFLYLDTGILSDLLSAFEGGARKSHERKMVAFDGEAQTPQLGELSASELREQETSLTFDDTPTAQFERLVGMASKNSHWVESVDPDADFPNLTSRDIVSISADLYVPDIVKALSPSGGLPQAMAQLDALEPFAQTLGLSTTGLPSREQRQAVAGFVSSMGSDLLAVGEFEDSEWSIAGQLYAGHLRRDIDGVATIVGKVSRTWKQGEWKPLLALPGSSLIPRERRRALERTRPKAGDEAQYLEGPAIMLDILAIYR